MIILFTISFLLNVVLLCYIGTLPKVKQIEHEYDENSYN